MKYDAIVKNWQIHELNFTEEQINTIYPGEKLKPMVFTGTVVKDKKGRFDPGFHMRSSLIKKIDRKNGFIITRKTVYKVLEEGNDIIPNMGHGVLSLFY